MRARSSPAKQPSPSRRKGLTQPPAQLPRSAAWLRGKSSNFEAGMRVRLTLFLLFLCPALAHASEVRGKIVNVVGGEPLARVQVTILETRAEAVTEKDGT